jgi:hypothetical protein
MTVNFVDWKNVHMGGTVFIFGNGPSLKEYFPYIKAINSKFESISMNRGYEVRPHGHYYVTLMDTFYLEKVKHSSYQHVFTVGSYTEIPQSIRWTFQPSLTFIPRLTKHDPTPDPPHMSKGWKVSHTGVLALYLASWMGFDKAVLLGYDGHGRHFLPRVQADDVPNHERHITEMQRFMALDHGMKIYNCVEDNGYEHEYRPFEEVFHEDYLHRWTGFQRP